MASLLMLMRMVQHISILHFVTQKVDIIYVGLIAMITVLLLLTIHLSILYGLPKLDLFIGMNLTHYLVVLEYGIMGRVFLVGVLSIMAVYFLISSLMGWDL